MSGDQPNHPDQPLRTLLQQWQVDAPLPPRFAETVWCRIAGQENRPSRVKRRLAMLVQWWELAVRRPVVALAYLGLLLGMGFSIGFWQAEHYAHSTEQAWQAAYVQSVSPNPLFRP